ncbi:Zona pellucida sperm-binding protein 3 [Anabarilius grahami]|uniref:Zona pellucida sperm-binding protein 3 n=1 Tax=Anabarilius grahami TaxID=495550 RepID=A0A3N0XFG3_ANAGA|nr:Zona pellucida sperm-binding protein 3 [Anabarilius grahami]
MTEFGKPSQDLMGVQSKELLQGPLVKLTWSFPSLPEEPQQPDIPFELPHPIPPNSVAAQCGENSVYVEVKEDFFGTGKPLISSAFKLGGCAATGEDPSAQVLIFESELHGCGSTSTVTEGGLVYTFNLIYTPQEASYGVPIVRSSGAVVGIECHYARMHNVSSNALMPTWIPHASTKVAEEVFVLSLKLMTAMFLSVCFVDSCVATAVPDVTSVPRYSFIENNGCLVDAKLTGSRSHFMPRTQIDKLQFQLDAFRFQQSESGLVYITCILKVAAASTPTGPEQKACSFSPNGYTTSPLAKQVGPRRLFFGRINMLNRCRYVGPSDHSDWLFSYCHLLVRKGMSSYAGAERTCYLVVGSRSSVWCVRATLDPNAADMSQPCSLLSSPLVQRRWLSVFPALALCLQEHQRGLTDSTCPTLQRPLPHFPPWRHSLPSAQAPK